jgi:hypothetical protein
MVLQVYNDAKRGTLSAWSYPSRHVANLIGERIDLQAKHSTFIPQPGDLQYVNPGTHRDILTIIAETDRSILASNFQNVLTASLRVDGAVDKQKIDNKHVMAKYVTNEGTVKTIYLGFSEKEESGSTGLYKAVQKATANSGIPWMEVFAKTTSVVTDGAAENTGKYKSLWTHLTEERNQSDHPKVPLIKIWCAVHRAQLAFKDMSKSVPEVGFLLADCKMTSTFYNVSAVRMTELKDAARECGVSVCHFPTPKDIRFTEYSYTLVKAVLRNYKGMIAHLQNANDTEGAGFLSKWLDEDTLLLTAILADALYVYKRFQKSIQSDQLNVFDLENARDYCTSQIRKLLTRPLPGGFEEQVIPDGEEGHKSFLGVALRDRTSSKKRSGIRHLYVTTRGRDVQAVKTEMLNSLINFLNRRLDIEMSSSSDASYSVQFRALSPECMKSEAASDDDVRRVYDVIVPDTNWQTFYASYGEVISALRTSGASTLQEILNFSLANKHWSTVSLALARLLVAKPHSTDVERLISAYNLLKDDDRSSLSATTIDAYLHVHINAPPLVNYDCRPAVNAWMNQASRRPHPVEKATQQDWFAGVFFS